MAEIKTKTKPTWCPGCSNFLILESVSRAVQSLIKQGWKKEEFVITTDIGCNSKIYDYLNLSGIYGLHGRSLATAVGVKLGNPKLNVIAFQGDGGAYDEGISHFIHACKRDNNVTLLVHDNQSFSLTTGQPTATTQEGYKSKASPSGFKEKPLNPIKLALASGTTFIARCNPFDVDDTARIIEAAVKHRGFSFVELMQKCLIFNTGINSLEKLMHKVNDNNDEEKAYKLADEWDYNTAKTGHDKIPIGILYEKI